MAVDIQQFRNFNGQSKGSFTRQDSVVNVGAGRAVSARGATEVSSLVRNYTAEKRGDNQTLIFPEEELKYYVNLQYAKYSRQTPLKVGFSRVGSIFLPLPVQGMSDTHEVDYIEETMGLAGTAATLFQNITGSEDSTTSSLLSNISELFQSFFAGIPGISSYFGASPNKFMTILLKGPRYKRHEFTWKLYPTSKNESLTIARMITQMNNAMAPGLTAEKLLFTFPYVFYMQYVPNAKYLYKFKPMVLESLVTNYASPGVPSFYADPYSGENPPEMIEIRARFLEIEYWLRNQFNLLSNAGSDGVHRRIDQAENDLRAIYNDVGAFVGVGLPSVNPSRNRAKTREKLHDDGQAGEEARRPIENFR